MLRDQTKTARGQKTKRRCNTNGRRKEPVRDRHRHFRETGGRGSAELVNKFKALIAEHGTVESVDDWGKRRFAYPIAKQTEGYYTLINFESNPEFTAELDRRYQITDGILRTIIIKRDPRHVASIKAQKAQKAEEKNIDVEAIAAEAVEAAAAESAE